MAMLNALKETTRSIARLNPSAITMHSSARLIADAFLHGPFAMDNWIALMELMKPSALASNALEIALLYAPRMESAFSGNNFAMANLTARTVKTK